MRVGRPRSAAVGLVVAGLMSLPAAGCGVVVELADRPAPGVQTPMSTPTAVVPLNPVEKLVDAAAKTNTGVITVVMRAPGMTTDARLDPDGRKATMRIVVGNEDVELLTAELIQIDSDRYLRVPDLPGVSRKWTRRDIVDPPPGSPLNLLPDSDHTGAADLANCIVSAKRHGGHDFTGVMDLTRSRIVSRKVRTELGERPQPMLERLFV